MRNKPHHLRPTEPVQRYIKSLNQTQDPRVQAWLDHCKKAAVSFTYFTEFMCGVRVHPGQVRVSDQMDVTDYNVVAAANGWGKTVFYGLKVMHSTWAKLWAPRGWGIYKAAVLAPWMQQALLTHEVIEDIRLNRSEFQEWCDHPAPCLKGFACPDRKRHPFRLSPWLIPFKTEATHLAYRWKHNSALIHFESGENKAANIEGWRLNVIIYDEARLELHLKHIVDQVFLARATRTPNQKILLGSTPLSDSYDFLEYYRKGEAGKKNWSSHMGSIRENIFLLPEQIEKVRDSLDERIRDQVLEGRWVAPPDSYFISDRVNECFDPGPEPAHGIDSYVGKARRTGQYVGGLDIAAAEGGDESVLSLWDVSVNPYRVVLEKVWLKGTALGTVISYCDVIIDEFSCAIAFDASSGLGVEFEHQVSHNPASYIPITFTGGNQKAQAQMKVQALTNMRHFINNKMVSWPYLPDTRKQFHGYQYPKDQNLRKDRLMSNVYAAWLAKDYANFSNVGVHINTNGPSYRGQGVSYGGRGDRPEWANKSPLQRQMLRLSEQREEERAIEALAEGQ